MFTIETILELFNNYSFIAIPLSIAISVIIAILGVIPSVFVTGANILFFGSIKGFVISLLGEVIGAYISFYIYRAGFKKQIEKIDINKYRILKGIVNGEGIKAFIFIIEGRIIPFLPSGFVTFAASVSKVRVKDFIIATAIGKIPSILLEALVSYDLININENYIRLIITLVFLIIGYIVLKKKIKL
ncbi:MAG: TVP38/TMEM64 family protein [Sarcina sp.]